jgi:hypothetical protein
MPRRSRFVWRIKIFFCGTDSAFSIFNFPFSGGGQLTLNRQCQAGAVTFPNEDIQSADVQLLMASQCFDDFIQQTEQFLIVGVH